MSLLSEMEEGTPGIVVCLYIYQVGQRVDGRRNVHYCSSGMEESLSLQFRDFFTAEGLVIPPRSTKWVLRRPRRQSFIYVCCVWYHPSAIRRMEILMFVPSINTLTSFIICTRVSPYPLSSRRDEFRLKVPETEDV